MNSVMYTTLILCCRNSAATKKDFQSKKIQLTFVSRTNYGPSIDGRQNSEEGVIHCTVHTYFSEKEKLKRRSSVVQSYNERIVDEEHHVRWHLAVEEMEECYLNSVIYFKTALYIHIL